MLLNFVAWVIFVKKCDKNIILSFAVVIHALLWIVNKLTKTIQQWTIFLVTKIMFYYKLNLSKLQIYKWKTNISSTQHLTANTLTPVQILLVIRQNGESQNGCFRKTKHAKFSEKRTFITPDTYKYVCVPGGKKCLFFGKFGVLCIFETPVLRFTLLPYYRRFTK